MFALVSCLLFLSACAQDVPDFVFTELGVNGSSIEVARTNAVMGVGDGTVLVLGGGPSVDFEYSFKHETWSELPTAIRRQYACGAQPPDSDFVWIFGGYEGVNPVKNTSSLIHYSTTTYNFTKLGSPDIPTIGTACAATTQSFYVFGGQSTLKDSNSNNLYVYNQKSGWNLLTPSSGPLPPPRSFASLVTYENEHQEQILVLFGGGNGTLMNDTWRFNLHTLSWSQDSASGNSRPRPRYYHTAVYNSMHSTPQMIVFGGKGADDAPYNDIWFYDLTTPTWSSIPSQPTWPSRRGGQSAYFKQGRMLLFGGTNASLHSVSDLWQFVPEKDCIHESACGGCLGISGCGWCTVGRLTSCVAGDTMGPYYAASCPGMFDASDEACVALPIHFDGWWVVLGLIGLGLFAGMGLFIVKSFCDPCATEPTPKTQEGGYASIN